MSSSPKASTQQQSQPLAKWEADQLLLSKHLERLVYARKLRHGGQPVLRYCADNTALLYDSNDNFRPDKRRSRANGRIDGIVAACMAGSMAMFVDPTTVIDVDYELA